MNIHMQDMGYLGNHLATVVTGAFAAVLTALWPIFMNFAPVLDFVFIMAVPITWFLVFTCWIAQKSADYMHASPVHVEAGSGGGGREILSQVAGSGGGGGAAADGAATPDVQELKKAQDELTADLNGLKETLKLKDGEIERLKLQITNLNTRMQIETLKTELANLKMLAAKQNTDYEQ